MKHSFEKIHLGCGAINLKGFLNIDVIDAPQVDYQADVRRLDFIPDGSAELVYSSHVLEHFDRNEVPNVLSEWCRY